MTATQSVQAGNFVVLPNGDLWRGGQPERPDNVQAPPAKRINSAMAEVLKTAGPGGVLTCLWCGQQPGDEKAMIAHLAAQHPAVVEPSAAEQAAMAAVIAENTKLGGELTKKD